MKNLNNKIVFSAAFLFFCVFAVPASYAAAPLFPDPWKPPSDPYPNGSCKSCAGGQEVPFLDQNGNMLMKRNLLSFSSVPSDILKIEAGVTTSFFLHPFT